MAGKPVGTIFVELDLDASRYTKGQQKLLKDAQTTSLNIEQNFKNLGIKSSAEMDLMRAKIKNSFDMIANSSRATANDIMRAEEAKNAKLRSLNDQQYGAQTSALDRLKKNWIAGSVAITAAVVAINKAMAYIEEGAAALQVESSFKIMADAAEVNSERLIAAMKEATKETIDDSAMMQKAIKLMTLGYDPEQIERFSKVVITASQIAGTTAAQAYDELADAIGNRAPKALVRMGAVTKEQMEVVNSAIDAGASSMALYELAMVNLELKQKMLQGTQNEAALTMQRLNTQISETTEAIGKGLIIAVDLAYRGFEYLAAGVLGLVSAYARYREIIYKVMGDEKQAADNRFVADVAYEARNDLLRRAGQSILDNASAEKRASKEEIAASKEKVDAKMADLKATISASKAAEEARKNATAEAKRAADEMRRLNEEVRKLEDQFSDSKIFSGEGSNYERMQAQLRSGSELTEMDARRQKSIEDQLAAMAKADRELSDSNWWKTYIEDTEDATRANEIFKDSMDVMSQSTADAMAKMAMGTGNLKDNFNAMVQSIIAGMIRMSTQQGSEALFGMLFKAGGSLLSAYGGGSTPSGMGSGAGYQYGGGTGDWAAVMHSGGTVGMGSFPQRAMPAWMIATAPRLHNGLASDEFPAVLQKGERVIKKGGAASTNNITINVAAPGGSMSRESLATLQASLFTTLQRAGQRNT